MMNLEETTMIVQVDGGQRKFQLRNTDPYVTQLRLLGRKISSPEMTPELPLFRSGVKMGLKIREVGLAAGVQPFETTAITNKEVERVFDRWTLGF
jgi:hypothetical protein